MAATGSITVGGLISGLPTGTKTFSATISSTNAVGVIQDVILQSGDNTISVPTNTTAVLIAPPATNTVALKVKGDAGDTGVLIHKTNPTLLALDPTQTTFIVNAASLTATATEFSFL